MVLTCKVGTEDQPSLLIGPSSLFKAKLEGHGEGKYASIAILHIHPYIA